MQIANFSEQIKALTWSSHQALEKHLVQVIRCVDSLAEYKKLLMVFWGYYQPVEKLIRQTLNPGSPVLHYSRKTDWLLSDLRQLDNGAQTIPVCSQLPRVSNHVQALASLYVLEGSTLGGKYILQMIRKRIDLKQGYADRFLTGHGSNSEANWIQFKGMLDAELTESTKQDFLETVNETFDLFKNWAVVNYIYDQQEKS